MYPATRISLAGFLATLVAYGPARIGFGLFLPQFRETFDISLQMAGLIASATFAAFLAGLVVAAAAAGRTGPRVPVIAGCAAAAAGMGLVASAQGAVALGIGCALAAASPGLAWAPFNIAVKRTVRAPLQGRVLAVVSTGTTLGIAGAAALALTVELQGLSWRASWTGFAALGALAALVNLQALRDADAPGEPATPLLPALPMLVRSLSGVPGRGIALSALSFGATSAVYLSFAADHVAAAGGLPGLPATSAGAAIFAAYGAGGAVGLVTGEVERRHGIRPILAGVFLASTLSLGVLAALPGTWPALALSAALQGACVMVISAVFSVSALRLFDGRPAQGFCALLTVFALGNLSATGAAGAVAEQAGLAPVFLAASAVSLGSAIAVLARPVRVPVPA